MLRITRKYVDERRVILALEGRVASDWVSVLESECGQAMAGENQLSLNCSGVTYVDARGMELLRRLIRRGVQVIDCPAMIRDLLESDA